MQAVILAGGLGTRLRPLTLSMPKPMVQILGRPFLDYELCYLRKNGFDEFVICIGYKGDAIRNYFADGREFSVSIQYSEDGPTQLGPAGALKSASPLLADEFMVTYGDSFLRIDYQGFENAFHLSERLGMMSVLENYNQFGKSDLVVKHGLVTEFNKEKQSDEMKWINYGATLLRKKALDAIPNYQSYGEEQFYNQLIARKELAAFEVRDRFYEIGTPAGLGQFEKFLSENPEIFKN